MARWSPASTISSALKSCADPRVFCSAETQSAVLLASHNKAQIGSRDGHIDIDLGERDRASFETAINLPINDNFAMRFAGYYSQEDGFAKNVYSGKDQIEHEKWAVRWSAFENDRLNVQTVVEYEERRQSGSMYRAIDTGDILGCF